MKRDPQEYRGCAVVNLGPRQPPAIFHVVVERGAAAAWFTLESSIGGTLKLALSLREIEDLKHVLKCAISAQISNREHE